VDEIVESGQWKVFRGKGADMTETVRSYRELKVWQKGIELVKMIYELSRSFPKSETFGLASQMQRAAVSIPSNIAEGQTTHR
jgi:hypothetical protein